MATLEMQATAELAESRRKMHARRRMKNRIALSLSMATMAFGLFWLWLSRRSPTLNPSPAPSGHPLPQGERGNTKH